MEQGLVPPIVGGMIGAGALGGREPRDRMLQFFSHGHLPDHLAKVSLPFCQLAEELCATLPSNPERTVALRKLLEAKDCAVRALLYQAQDTRHAGVGDTAAGEIPSLFPRRRGRKAAGGWRRIG